jgi:acyl-CoA reductase-like NAD-dependent aldehyde dehydrogenase
MKVWREEVFGPVATLTPFEDFNEALELANDSVYGLQAGVFTNTLSHAWRAFETLEVGGVIINDAPVFRVDHMPYGGVKASGLGREGVRYAIEEHTEIRLLALRV